MIKDICEDLKAVIPLVVKMFISTIKFHKSFKFMPNIASPLFYVFLFFVVFKGLTFVGSAWSFGFFIPATKANDLRLRRIFYPRFYPLHLFSILNF